MKIASTVSFQNIQGYKFGSYPFKKPKIFVYAWFLDGLLIDTGHRNMRKEILVHLTPLPVEQIFITHHHEDHNGNLKPLQAYFKCPTFASPQCTKIMKNPPSITFAQWLLYGQTDPNIKIQPLEGTLQTTNYQFQIIPIPGHAVDMVGLYEPNQGWFFSSDLWVYDYIRFFMEAESMKQQIESLKRVMELDFDVLLCSHNPQFQNGKSRIQKKLTFLEGFYAKVVELYQKGYDANAIFKHMGLKEHWETRILSGGALSGLNMVKSVIRDEQKLEN